MSTILALFLTCFSYLSLASGTDTASLKSELSKKMNVMVSLLERAEAGAIINYESSQKIANCYGIRTNAECKQINEMIFDPFPQVIAEARMHLAFSHRDGFFEKNMLKLNSGLDSLHTFKDKKWKPLDQQEIAAAQKILDAMIKEAKDKISAKFGPQHPKFNYYVELEVRQKRNRHFEIYKILLSQIVILQFVEGRVMTPEMIRTTLKTIVTRGKKEVDELKKAAHQTEKWVKSLDSCVETLNYQLTHTRVDGFSVCDSTPSALEKLLDYTAIVDGLLLEAPEYESVVKRIRAERTTKQIGLAVITILPLLAASAISPPLVAIPLALMSGGATFVSSQMELNRVKDREFSQVTNAAGNVDWDALKSARLNRTMSFALMPFVGGSKLTKIVLNRNAQKMISGLNKAKLF